MIFIVLSRFLMYFDLQKKQKNIKNHHKTSQKCVKDTPIFYAQQTYCKLLQKSTNFFLELKLISTFLIIIYNFNKQGIGMQQQIPQNLIQNQESQGKSTNIVPNFFKKFIESIQHKGLTFLLQTVGDQPKNLTVHSQLILLFIKISQLNALEKGIFIDQIYTGTLQKMINFRTKRINDPSTGQFHRRNMSILERVRAIALKMWLNEYIPNLPSIRQHLATLISLRGSNNPGNITKQTAKINDGLDYIFRQLEFPMNQDVADQQQSQTEDIDNDAVSYETVSQISKMESLMDQQDLICSHNSNGVQLKDCMQFESLLSQTNKSQRFDVICKSCDILNCEFANVE